jgi:hypothetical protein
MRGVVPGTATEVNTCSTHGTWFDWKALPHVAPAFHRPPANVLASATAFGEAILTEDHAVATRLARFIAAGIDGSIAAVGFMALLVVGMFLGALSPVLVVVIPPLGVLLFQCFQWFLLARDGQTIGKRLEGLRLVRQDGSPAWFLAAVVLRAACPESSSPR